MDETVPFGSAQVVETKNLDLAVACICDCLHMESSFM